MTYLKFIAAAAATAAVGLASPAFAAGFVNGSFETNTCTLNGSGFSTVLPGNTCISGWSVGPHSVDLVSDAYWQAKDGRFSVDLSGSAPGSISQTFDTVVGQLYDVRYWLSGNPDGGDAQKFGIVAAVNGSTTAAATFLGIAGSSHANMNYQPWLFQFKALTPQTTLSFAGDGTDGAYGAVLDAVSVTNAVPEPGTWATMLLGFGLVGFGLRKRKAAARQTRLRIAYA